MSEPNISNALQLVAFASIGTVGELFSAVNVVSCVRVPTGRYTITMGTAIRPQDRFITCTNKLYFAPGSSRLFTIINETPTTFEVRSCSVFPFEDDTAFDVLVYRVRLP